VWVRARAGVRECRQREIGFQPDFRWAVSKIPPPPRRRIPRRNTCSTPARIHITYASEEERRITCFSIKIRADRWSSKKSAAAGMRLHDLSEAGIPDRNQVFRRTVQTTMHGRGLRIGVCAHANMHAFTCAHETNRLGLSAFHRMRHQGARSAPAGRWTCECANNDGRICTGGSGTQYDGPRNAKSLPRPTPGDAPTPRCQRAWASGRFPCARAPQHLLCSWPPAPHGLLRGPVQTTDACFILWHARYATVRVMSARSSRCPAIGQSPCCCHHRMQEIQR